MSARRNAGSSRELLAHALGKSVVTVARYEQGRTQPDAATVVAIAGLLKVSVAYLYGESTGHDPVVSRFAAEVDRLVSLAPPLSARQQAEIRALFRTIA